jgi:hypothetical protein
VAADFDSVLREQARELIDPDEEILAYVVAQLRGTGVARSSANLGAQAVGDVWARKWRGGAEGAGLELSAPMALALTQRRLLVFRLETSALGKPKAVKELHSAAPLEDVETITVKRLLVGKTMKIAMQGGDVKLEIGAGQDAKGLAEQFERARATA